MPWLQCVTFICYQAAPPRPCYHYHLARATSDHYWFQHCRITIISLPSCDLRGLNNLSRELWMNNKSRTCNNGKVPGIYKKTISLFSDPEQMLYPCCEYFSNFVDLITPPIWSCGTLVEKVGVHLFQLQLLFWSIEKGTRCSTIITSKGNWDAVKCSNVRTTVPSASSSSRGTRTQWVQPELTQFSASSAQIIAMVSAACHYLTCRFPVVIISAIN